MKIMNRDESDLYNKGITFTYVRSFLNVTRNEEKLILAKNMEYEK